MKVTNIQEELKNVKIENHLEFFGERYEFWKCEECFGPMLGHMIQKCPKIEYDEKVVPAFEIYLKRIGGFKKALWEIETRK